MSVSSRIRGLHELLAAKKISAAELTKAYRSAIEKHNEALGAYVSTSFETAEKAAEQADKRIAQGDELPLLWGIPMALKDNISTTGLSTTCCSKILSGYTPIYDATLWERLKAQGAVLLGKTNMDEFAMGSSTETSCYFPARNPHDPTRVAGGSSGGSASSVAANLAAYSIGSDTGGSIRQPASFCGIVGFKPTYGRVSRYGLIAYASSLDQMGPLAPTVEDAAIIYSAIAGYDPKDSTSSQLPVSPVDLSGDIRGLKIALPQEYISGVGEEAKAAILAAVKTYESLGAIVEEISLPSASYSLPVYYILACAEASSNLARYDGIRYGYKAEQYTDLDDMVCKTRTQGFGKEVQRRILLGNYVLSAGYYDAYYKKAQNLRRVIIRDIENIFEKYDAILTPTVPSTAFELGFAPSDPVETYLTDICTVTANIAGLPGISLPCGTDSKGLPIGMQLMAKRFEDSRLLKIAHAYEQAAGEVCKKIDLLNF